MGYRVIPLAELLVNRSNDRHGELENETAAIIGGLFSNHLSHMRNWRKTLYRCAVYTSRHWCIKKDLTSSSTMATGAPTCLKLLADATLSMSVLDEVNRLLIDSAKPVVHVFLPETTDAGQLAEWAALTQFAKWQAQGHDVRFIIPDAALRAYDGARKLALYDLGQRLVGPAARSQSFLESR